MLAKANEVLNELSADPEVQRLAQEREGSSRLCQFELEMARWEAREQGREQGLEQQRLLVLRMLQRRVGDVPGDTRERIEGASSGQLAGWEDAVFDAESLEAPMRGGAPPAGQESGRSVACAMSIAVGMATLERHHLDLARSWVSG